MGWTKHSDAVQAHRVARSESYVSVKKLAQEVRREVKNPDDLNGVQLFELAYDLHAELQRFARLRSAVGGQEDVSLKPFIDLLLEIIPQIGWTHVRENPRHLCTSSTVRRD